MKTIFNHAMPHVQSWGRIDGRKNFTSFLFSRYFAVLALLFLLAGQAWGQTITNVVVAGTPVCAGSTVNLSFLVTNGGNGNRFTVSTNYTVFLNSTQVYTGTFASTPPPNSTGATATMSRSITIPPGTTSGTTYAIRVSSVSPTYNITNATNPSSTFTVGSVLTLTSASTAICLGGSTTLSGNVTAYGNWTITLSTGETVTGTGSGTWSKLVTPAVTTDYSISSFITAGCAQTAAISGTSTITVNDLTNITTHPSVTPQNYCQNDAATALFISTNVTATSHEWYSNTIPSNAGGTLIPSATTNSYTPPTSTNGVLYYYCKVLAPCGNQTSNVSGAITVNFSPTISAQPASSIPLICAVNDPTPALSVTASAGSGNITQYEWYSNTTASNSGGMLVQTNVTSSTTNTYTPSTNSPGTLYYYCVVRNSNGCSVTSSVSGAVTVTLSIITQPVASQTVVVGASASFTVVAPPTGTTYQWNKNGTPIPGATSSTYTIPTVGASDAATYTVEVTNSTCTPPVTSNPSVLIVVSAQPTVQASTIVFTAITSTSLTLNWTNGNGARRIIVARAGAAVNHDPVDGTDYTASTVFGSGSETEASTANYVVFNNTGTGAIIVTGLLPSTNYYFKVYEYNGTGTSSNYYVASATKNPNNQSTRPTTQSSGVSFTNVAHNSMTVNWTGGDGANRIVVARAGGLPTIPTDGVIYTASAAFGPPGSLVGPAGRVVYNGSGSSVTVTNLAASTAYSFDIYEYAGSLATASATDKTVYLTPGVTLAQTTTAAPTNASNIVFSPINSLGMTLTWTNGTGGNRIVVAHAGSAVDANPANGTSYTANAVFQSGSQIGTGNYVVYKGNGSSVAVTGLQPSTNYYFKVYEYSGAPTYNTASTTNNPNNQSTRPSVLTTLAAIPFPADSATSLQMDWINGNGTRRIVVVHEAAVVNSNPIDGAIYTANSLFEAGSQIGTGNWVVYDGTGTSVTVTGLQDGTTYYFKIFEYAGTNATPSATDRTVYLTAGVSDIIHSTPARFSYRTQNSGVWTDVSNWQTFNVKTGSWPSATKLPNKNSSITISAGNIITINSNVTTDNLTIDGTLTVSNTGSLSIDANSRESFNLSIGGTGKLNVYGTFTVADKAKSVGHTAANTHFYSGSTYIHEYRQTEGIIPLATWDPGATLQITGYTSTIAATAAGNWGQSFTNVIFNCPLSGTNSLDLNGLLTSIGGDLSVTNSGGSGQIILNGGATSPTITIAGNIALSGSSTLCLNTIGSSIINIGNAGTGSVTVAGTSRFIANTTGSPTVNIPDNLLISSTNATGSSFNTSGNSIINIDGSLTMTGAGGLLSFGSGAAAGSATVNLQNNLLFTGATVRNASTNASNFGQINFNGVGVHTFLNAGTMSGKIHMTVSSFNILDVGVSAVIGTGNFTLSSNSTLRVASTHAGGAIQAGATGGNFQTTGLRTFASASTIEFNGVAPQVIGNGYPSTASINLINNNITGLTAPAGTLTLTGNFTNNGLFIPGNGTVAFAANSATKLIDGSAKITFNNLTINAGTASPDVRLENTVGAEIKGILDLTTDAASTLDADGIANNRVLTLLSTGDSPTVDASVAAMNISGGQVQGDVTVQRFMSKEGGVNNNTRIYRYIASPLQNATVADIQQEIFITGTFLGASTCSGCGKTSPSMYNYDESVSGNLNTGYVEFPVNTNTETLVPGVGYAMYVRGDILTSAKWDVRGTLNSGVIALPVTSSGATADDGWNLVANPFASTIDWDAPTGWTKTNMNDAVYITDNGVATFATYINGVGLNNGSNFIASGQAFWVKADAAPVLTVDERAKAAGTQTIFFRNTAPEDLLRITLTNGGVSDEAVIYFKNNSTLDFDRSSDAFKMKNPSFNVSSIIRGGVKLAINSLPKFDCNYEIKLAVENVPAGNYNLDFSEFESFGDGVSIIVKDNFTKTEFDIREVTSYAFAVTSDVKSYGLERFSIAFAATTANDGFDVTTLDACMGNDAEVTIIDTSRGMLYEVLRSDGSVLNSASGNGSVLPLTIAKENLVAGENTFTIRSTSSYCSLATFEKAIAFTIHDIPSASAVENGKACREGVITLKASGSPDGNYNWYKSESDQVPIADQHSSTFMTPFLVKSKDYYVSSINLLGCEGPRTSVQAEVVQYEEAVITLTQPRELTSNYSQGNQWYFNGEIISKAISQSIKPTRPGTYKVEVQIAGCTTSDELYFSSAETAPHGESSDISTFPNPIKSSLNVTLPNPENLPVIFRMTDIAGESFHVQVTEPSPDGIYTMNTAHLPSGLYILNVRCGAFAKTVKVLKE